MSKAKPNRQAQMAEWKVRRREMLELKDDGFSGPEIAKRYGIKPQMVYRLIEKAKEERAQERRLATLKAKEEQAQV